MKDLKTLQKRLETFILKLEDKSNKYELRTYYKQKIEQILDEIEALKDNNIKNAI